MYKSILLLIILVSLLGCNKEKFHIDTPTCIENKISDILNEPVWDPPAKIYSYQFNDQTVFYFPIPGCCDMTSILYDDNCNIICLPDGGITGSGDGQCLNFFDERSNEDLVWEDDRQ